MGASISLQAALDSILRLEIRKWTESLTPENANEEKHTQEEKNKSALLIVRWIKNRTPSATLESPPITF